MLCRMPIRTLCDIERQSTVIDRSVIVKTAKTHVLPHQRMEVSWYGSVVYDSAMSNSWTRGQRIIIYLISPQGIIAISLD